MKVILPLDGSPSSMRAVDQVLSLGQRIKGEPFEVDLVNVQDAAVGFSGLMGRDAADVRSVVLVGESASSIASHVERHGADAVVMGTRGLGTVGGLVLGSVATKVIHLVKPPVTLVK